MLPPGPGGPGLQGAFGDEVVHGILAAGLAFCRQRRAGAGRAGALHGGIGCRRPLCRGTAPIPGRNTPTGRVRIRPSLLPSTEVYSVLRETDFRRSASRGGAASSTRSR